MGNVWSKNTSNIDSGSDSLALWRANLLTMVNAMNGITTIGEANCLVKTDGSGVANLNNGAVLGKTTSPSDPLLVFPRAATSFIQASDSMGGIGFLTGGRNVGPGNYSAVFGNDKSVKLYGDTTIETTSTSALDVKNGSNK